MKRIRSARFAHLLITFFCAVCMVGAEKEKPAEPAAKKGDLPPPAEILERFAKEIGGKEAFRKHNSQHAKGTLEMPAQQVKGTMEVFAARPNKLKMIMTMEGVGEFITGFDGKVGWMNSQLTGPMVLSGKMLQEISTQADFDHTLHDPADYKVAEVLGREEFNGEECYKLKLVHKSGFESIEYFSVKTGLQKGFTATQETPLGAVTATTLVSEYKKFGDLTIPAKVIQKVSGMETVMTITEMEYDKVDLSVFDLPSQVKPLLEKPASNPEKDAPPSSPKDAPKKEK